MPLGGQEGFKLRSPTTSSGIATGLAAVRPRRKDEIAVMDFILKDATGCEF